MNELELLEALSKKEIVVRSRNSTYMNPEDNKNQPFIHLTSIGVNFKGTIEVLREALLRLNKYEKELSGKRFTYKLDKPLMLADDCISYYGISKHEEMHVATDLANKMGKLEDIYDESHNK